MSDEAKGPSVSAEEALRESQLRLLQAQRMESIGRLVGGVAHDFNNLLNVVIGNADLLLESTTPGSPEAEAIREILDAGRRGAALTRKLLAFGRRHAVERRQFDPAPVVADCEKLLRRVVGEDVTLAVRAGGTGWLDADPGQLEQILFNLVVNAREAMPAGGRIVVDLADAELDSPVAGARGPAPPGSYVRLRVTDSGPGLPEALLEQAFEPFFTTKGPAASGLGLSAVERIAIEIGGFVAVESRPDEGATIAVYLPRAGELREASPAPAAAGSGATILLVEDDSSVRELTARQLRRMGYRVLAAGDATEALAAASAESGAIDLVMADVVLPGLSGAELVSAVRRMRPAVRSLFVSGYSHPAPALEEVIAGGFPVLAKPFGQAELRAAVTAALAADP